MIKQKTCPECKGRKCEDCHFNGFILVDAEPIQDFWIYSGRSNPFELREEIYNQGGQFVREKGQYLICGISRDCDAYSVLTACGLRLLAIPGSERE